MAHILLAWELGGGLGHAGRTKILAQELLARGHRVTVSLRDLVQPQRLLADLDVPMFQSPVWLHKAMGLPAVQGNLAEILFQYGYLDAQALHGLVTGWRTMFQQTRPDLVVADYAPTAIVAARSLGLRSASVGVGFYSPPARRPLPPLRDWEAIPEARLRSSEARLVDTVNSVLDRYGAPHMQRGADVLLGDTQLLCAWPELDHYQRGDDEVARWYGPTFLPQGGEAPQWPPGDGPRVFAYLKASHPEHADVLKALVAEGCRVLCYLPEVAGGMAPPVIDPLLHYAKGPVSLDAACREAALFVCHAGAATLAQALLAGVPLLLMPMQTEQFLVSRRLQKAGAGLNAGMLPRPADWRGAVRQMLGDSSYRRAALAFAARHSGFAQQAQVAALVDALESPSGVSSGISTRTGA
jgi:UDP:flavonoid glycosyltransferase YjiC (YdhE family)